MSSVVTPDPTLHENAKRVLAAIAEDGSADTSEIRNATGLSAQNIGYHTDRLAELGLIETTGTRDVGAPAPANVYCLTDAGEQRAAALEAPLTRAELQAELRAAQDRIDELERRLDTETDRLDDRVDEQADRVDDFRGRMKTILRRAGIGGDR